MILHSRSKMKRAVSQARKMSGLSLILTAARGCQMTRRTRERFLLTFRLILTEERYRKKGRELFRYVMRVAEGEKTRSEMGMSLSTFFMIYAVRVLRERRIPFYSPANMERLKKSIAQPSTGEGTEHELIEAG